MPTETRYFRNAKWNGNYQLGTENTTTGSNLYLRYYGFAPSGMVGFRIFKVVGGEETELTTDIISTAVTQTGYCELTWDAPTDEYFDKIRVKVYLKIGTIDWTLKGVWDTEQIGGILSGGTWNIWAYCDIEAGFRVSTVYFYFGSSVYTSRIENFSYTIGAVTHKIARLGTNVMIRPHAIVLIKRNDEIVGYRKPHAPFRPERPIQPEVG